MLLWVSEVGDAFCFSFVCSSEESYVHYIFFGAVWFAGFLVWFVFGAAGWL